MSMTTTKEEPVTSRNVFAEHEDDVEARGVGLRANNADVGDGEQKVNDSTHRHHHHKKKRTKLNNQTEEGTAENDDGDTTRSKHRGRKSMKERASKLKDDVMEGYHKGTGFLYAFRGIWFFVFNPSLWFVVVCPLACASFFSVLSVVLLLAFALPAQAHALYNAIETAWFPMWLAWLISVALTLLESAIVVMLLTQLLFNCYKGMLEERVFRLRGIATDDSSTVAVACANVVSQALFAWLVMLCTVPLNLVPVVGNVVFFFLSGTVFAWNLHASYFGSKDLGFGQQLRFVAGHWFDYMSFGFVCLALDMIPIVNFFFIFTNMVGASLWAADLEKSHALEPYLEAQSQQMEALERSRKKLRKRRIQEARRKRKHAKKMRRLRREQRLLDSDYDSEEFSSESNDGYSSSSSSSGDDGDSGSESDDEMPRTRQSKKTGEKSNDSYSSNTNAPTATSSTPAFIPTTTTTTTTPVSRSPSSSGGGNLSYAPTETTKLTSPTVASAIAAVISPFHRSAPAPPPSSSDIETTTTTTTKPFPIMPMPTFAGSPNNRREYEEIDELPPSDIPPTESRSLLSSPNATDQ